MCKIITYEVRNEFFRKHQNPEFEINFDSKESDWANAIYFFVEEKNLRKYNDDEHPYPMVVKNQKPFKCIVCYMDCFANGTYNENDMNKLIKEIKSKTDITTNPKNNFMEWLGEYGYAFQCYHDKDKSMEIAIPFQLLKNMEFTHEPIQSVE